MIETLIFLQSPASCPAKEKKKRISKIEERGITKRGEKNEEIERTYLRVR